MFRILFYLFLFFITLFPINTVLAVANLPLGTVEQISVKTTPEKPGPNTPVTIRIDSYSSDLNKALITWSVNGKVVIKGKGENVFNFQTGPLGSKTTVNVVVAKEEGGALERYFVFQPAAVSLVYESYSYTPPFYRGKALFGHQSKFKVVAFPEITNATGAVIPANQLIYKWKNNFKVLQSQSGYGKYFLEVEGPLLSEQQRIDVEVTAPNSDVVAKSFILVDPIEPQVLLYEYNPLLGYLFNNSITRTMALSGKETSIEAFPYFFSTGTTQGGNIRYDWTLNGNPIYNNKDLSSLVLRNENNIDGQARISVHASNAVKMLQFGDASFVMSFKKSLSF